MDMSNIVVYVIVAVIAMFVLPKLGIKIGRGGGNSPLNPPGNNPGGGGGGGGGLLPGSPATPNKPASQKPSGGDNDGDFVDRVEGDKRPEKAV